MAELNQALFRIDPTEGLLLYVQDIKPYHSKVLDVLVEYVYTEPMIVVASDRSHINVGLPAIDVDDPLRRSSEPIIYSRGYGYVWSAYDNTFGGLPEATIISAQSQLRFTATAAGTTLSFTNDDSQYVFTVGDQVTLTTTGTFPTVSVGSQIAQGGNYYVVSVGTNAISISSQPGGTPIQYASGGTGVLTIIPLNLPINSFLIDTPAPVDYDIVVSSVSNNQITFGTPYAVTNVNTTSISWSISGNLLSSLASGDKIYINGNSDATSNREYTVVTASYNSGTNKTTISVAEPISLTATATGDLYIPVSEDFVPFWPAGSAVKFSTNGTLPFPLNNTDAYYIVPTSRVGVFNISTQRYPQDFSGVFDIMSAGTGRLTIRKVEPFLPGEYVDITGTYLGMNNGRYVIQTIEEEGAYHRAFVREAVTQTTPPSLTTDGTIRYVGSFGDPVATVVSAPPLFTAAYFHERINFEFGPGAAAYLLDTFSGTGNLATHTVDSGHSWTIFQLSDDLKELVLNGNGGLITTDTDIWVRSTWLPPAAPSTYYVEVDLYVKEHPGAGSPYFRFFTKEANVATFYGPHVDIKPNATTGKIDLQLWLGDSVVGSFVNIPTNVLVNSTITVRIELTLQNQVKVYVNGSLVYTSVPVTWPTLTFVGFNFRVPSGDPSQFVLQKILASS